jgi:hypothetical protein
MSIQVEWSIQKILLLGRLDLLLSTSQLINAHSTGLCHALAAVVAQMKETNN